MTIPNGTTTLAMHATPAASYFPRAYTPSAVSTTTPAATPDIKESSSKYTTVVATPEIEEKPQERNADNSQVVQHPAFIETTSNRETRLGLPDGWVYVEGAQDAVEFVPKRDPVSVTQYFNYQYLTEGVSKYVETFKENFFTKKDSLATLTNTYKKIEENWVKNQYFSGFVSRNKELADAAIPIVVRGKFAVEDALAGNGSYEEITTIKTNLEKLLLKIKKFEKENPIPDYAVWDNKICGMLIVGASLSGLLAAPGAVCAVLVGLAFTIKGLTTILTKLESTKTEDIIKIRDKYLEPLTYELIERINEMPDPVTGTNQTLIRIENRLDNTATTDAVKKAEAEAAQARAEAAQANAKMTDLQNQFSDAHADLKRNNELLAALLQGKSLV